MTASDFWNPDISLTIDPPARVVMDRGVWHDPHRGPNHGGRAVPYKAYYPDGATGPIPLILWSHGLGGSRDGAGFIARFLAGHGYGVVHLTHAGTDSSLWEGKPGHPWDVIRATPIPRKASLQRFLDVPFALRQILSGHLPFVADADRVGMSGHSFGALTTQMIAGQSIASPRRAYALPKLNIRAGVLYSPVPLLKYRGTPERAYGSIHMPLMHWTGTDDVSPIEGFGYARRLQIFEHAGSHDQHLVILKDGDHMVYNGSRGQLGENPKRGRHEDLIKIGSLAWWDWRLKDDAAARDWLTGGGFKNFAAGDLTYTMKDQNG